MAEFPLLVFTVLTGLAAGGYVMCVVFGLLAKQEERSWIFPAMCVVLLGVGMLGVLFHLGRPERFLNALANPTAMITQEAYWSIPFGIILVIDAVLLKLGKGQNRILAIIGALAGCGLMTVTSIAYFTSYGVPVWPHIPTLALFIVGDLSLGAAFTLAMHGSQQAKRCIVVSAVLALALVLTCIAEGVVFAGFGLDIIAFVVATILAAAGAGVAFAQNVGKAPRTSAWFWAVFALIALAVIVSRFAFYAVA